MLTLNEILEREYTNLLIDDYFAEWVPYGRLTKSGLMGSIMGNHKCDPDQLTGNDNIYEFDGRYFDCENNDYENAIEVFKQITYTMMENPIGQI